MKEYGGIIGVGVVALLVIIIGNMIGLPPHIAKGLTFVGIGVILFMASAAAWSLHWIVGLVGLIAAIVFLGIGVSAFSQ